MPAKEMYRHSSRAYRGEELMTKKVFVNPVETALVVIDMQKDFCCADCALFVCD
jgi:hypothetical protein